MAEIEFTNAAVADLSEIDEYSLAHRKHRIFYRVEGENVLIVRILHHARDAKGMLGEVG